MRFKALKSVAQGRKEGRIEKRGKKTTFWPALWRPLQKRPVALISSNATRWPSASPLP